MEILEKHYNEIIELFKKHKVIEVYIFGSILSKEFNNNSDIDFLIKFQENIDPLERGDLWWSLYYSLKDLLKREIDLVTTDSLKNPYFIKELERTKQIIYGE